MPLKKLSQLLALGPSTGKVRKMARHSISQGKKYPKGHPLRASHARAASNLHTISQIGSGLLSRKK